MSPKSISWLTWDWNFGLQCCIPNSNANANFNTAFSFLELECHFLEAELHFSWYLLPYEKKVNESENLCVCVLLNMTRENEVGKGGLRTSRKYIPSKKLPSSMVWIPLVLLKRTPGWWSWSLTYPVPVYSSLILSCPVYKISNLGKDDCEDPC